MRPFRDRLIGSPSEVTKAAATATAGVAQAGRVRSRMIETQLAEAIGNK
jgi:hypothetical protein